MDGGAELRLLHMARKMNKEFEVTLFLPDQGPLYEVARDEGIQTVDLNFARLRRYRGSGWLKWWRSVRQARGRLAKELVSRQVQLVHFNDLIDLPFYGVPHRLGIPAIAHLRFILDNPLAKILYRQQTKRSGVHVLPVSGAVARAMLPEGGSIPYQVLHDPSPDRTLFRPCDASFLEERRKIRAGFGWAEDDFVVVMVSKLLEAKGHLNFLAVADLLKQGGTPRFRLLMVAGPSPGRERYQREVLARAEALAKGTFQWIPGASHGEIPQLLRSSDCFLHLPDTEDSLPGVILEAMACGVPVVSWRRGGIPEELEEGAAGLLVDSGDLQSVAAGVRALSSNPDLWEKLARQALKRLDSTFSESAHFDRLESINWVALQATSPD